MTKTTIDTGMPPPTTAPQEPLIIDENNSLKMKLYVPDYELAHEIQKEAAPFARRLTVQQILREAIHIGLPTVQKRYRAAVEAARKT